MTEYDYSPDAYERYLATQQRIARWVENTNQYPKSNPFVLSPTIDPKPIADSPPTTSSRVASQSAGSGYSKTRTRSSSDATYCKPEGSHPSKAPLTAGQRSSTEHSQSPSQHASSSRSRPPYHSRHSSQSTTSRYTSGSNRTQTTTSSYKTINPSKDRPTYIKRSNTTPILVPLDGGRGGYVIVPPKGTRMEVLVSSCLLLLLFLSWWLTFDNALYFD